MIGETSALVNQFNVDRVYKENNAKGQGNAVNADETEASGGNVMDTASFSPQALALAKQVAPVGESPAEEQSEMEQGQMQEPVEEKRDSQGPRYLDIRV